MLVFESDYTEGAHPLILEKLVETNFEQLSSYGGDKYSESAKEKIKKACGIENGDVYFLAGGTQTNSIVIGTMLKQYEGVVAATTGHVNCHEAGAIEHTGHKVLQIPEHYGKIDAGELETFVSDFYADENHEHMVFPGMVYISHPTEYGTLYSRDELQKISEICKKYNMPLYMDGARMGYGLMSYDTDVTLKDIASLCDVFYIGGTKVGALCGEALVFPNGAPKYFMTMVKQHGALLAKGRVIGVQFDVLFTDELYFKISRHAIEMAQYMKNGLEKAGYKFFMDSPTNQQFIIMENEKLAELEGKATYSFWEKYDENNTVIRFATSWATRKEAVDQLINLLK